MTASRALGMMTAALVAAVVVWVAATLPPARTALVVPAWQSPTVVTGAFHVHTARSDGTGTVGDIAAAAARAGLKFVILTDHGDGTRTPDPPSYRSGVLSIDAVEISTDGGHYVALGLGPTPYPLGGEARDVVEDVARLGGFGIATHPTSAKPELRWKAWDAPFDGFEWLNSDSEWRDKGFLRIARAVLGYPVRGPESLAALFNRPDRVLAQWDRVGARRHIVAVAGADAHARFGFRGGDPYDRTSWLKLPSYEASFRVFALRVEIGERLSGGAASDAARLLDGLKAGHLYTAIDALAGPAAFEFRGRSGSGTASEGDDLPLGGPVEISARSNAPPGASTVLFRNGRIVRQASGPVLTYAAKPAPAVFRIEVRMPNAPGTPPVPWIVSNPIYVGSPPAATTGPPPRSPATQSTSLLDGAGGSDWHMESDRASRVSMIRAGGAEPAVAFSGTLGAGAPAGQFIAAARNLGTGGVVGTRRISFRARADRPSRLSVQLRVAGQGDGRRWRRSVYVDNTLGEFSVPLEEMTPVEPALGPHPDLGRVDTLLFVLDTVNLQPGSQRTIRLERVRLER
jgi:hypothetical protein